MTAQGDLFAGEAARDKAIALVEGGAEWWCARIVDLVRAMPRGVTFASDDLWVTCERLGLKVAEPRAMGAALRNARFVGLIEPTGEYRKSTRPECHARPVLVWRRR